MTGDQALLGHHRPTDPAADPGPALALLDVAKTYGNDRGEVSALRDVSLSIDDGQLIAVMGPSGSGKSTLLQCAAGLVRPDRGSVRLGPTELTGLREAELTKLRRDRLGFVFQSFNLLSGLTAKQNIELPTRLDGRRVERGALRALADELGIGGVLSNRPAEMSGGERQRVALARALIGRPDVVLADEPTGALDIATAAEILGLLRAAVERGQAVLMVTHDPVAAARADAVVFLADGEIVASLDAPTPEAVSEHFLGLARAR